MVFIFNYITYTYIATPYIKPLKKATAGHLIIHILVLHDNTCVHKGDVKKYNELIYLN